MRCCTVSAALPGAAFAVKPEATSLIRRRRPCAELGRGWSYKTPHNVGSARARSDGLLTNILGLGLLGSPDADAVLGNTLFVAGRGRAAAGLCAEE